MSPQELYTIDVSSTSQRGICYLGERESFNPSSGLDNYIFLSNLKLGSSLWAYSVPITDMQLNQRFTNLVREWKRETVNISSIQQMVLHSCYQEIIAMGPKAIHLILNELKQEPDFWFWALRALTREDPVKEEIRGNVMAMREAWLDWGREHAYL